MNQVELHPYLQQEKLLEYCRNHKILVTAYSPAGQQRSPGLVKAQNKKKKNNLDDEPSLLGKNDAIGEIADATRAHQRQVYSPGP